MKSLNLTTTFLVLFCLNALSQSTGFEWANSIISSGMVSPSSVETDSNGNIFVSGEFTGRADFDPGEDSLFLESYGHDDIFISKYNILGQLIWAFNIGEDYNDVCNSMTLDEDFNIYITGRFARTVDFDPGNGTHELSTTGSDDIFIAKYDSAGNFKWAYSMGLLNATDEGTSVTTDKDGNVLVTGWFQGTVDFDPGEGVHNLTTTRTSCFILKLSDDGNFIWAEKINSTGGSVEGHTIKTDQYNNVYISGMFEANADFNPGTGTYNMEPDEEYAAFLVKLDKNGNFKWALQPGGHAINTNLDKKRPFDIDKDGNIYLAFDFSNTADFDPSEEETLLSADGAWADLIIQKLDSLGNLIWVKQIGGDNNDEFGGMFLDKSGNMFITGFINGTVDFDPGDGVYEISAREDWEVALFVAKYNSEGDFVWGHPINWKEPDSSWPYGKGFDITLDPAGNVITVGQFSGSYNFNPDGVPSVLTSTPDMYSGFMLKLNGISSGTNTLTTNDFIHFYPNPFSNKITISATQQLQNAELWLHSVSGQTIIHKNNVSGSNIELVTGNIPAGIYFLEIKQKDNQFVGKVMKQ
ncbi:MAG: SBBP repeat-containing protein [Prolixibacteraceae bacterium]